MSYLRAHPRRAMVAALAILAAVIIIATVVILLTRAESGTAPQTEETRAIGRALIATSPAPLPRGTLRDTNDGYGAAVAEIARRARAAGVVSPNARRRAAQIGSWANMCCDGDVGALERRARTMGVSRADLESAAETMILVWGYMDQRAMDLPEPSLAEVSREIAQRRAMYERAPVSLPIVEVTCRERACAESARRLLAAGTDPEEISRDLTREYSSAIVNGGAATGPAAVNAVLWRALEKGPVGTTTARVLRLPTGEWVAGRVRGAVTTGRAAPASAIRERAAMAIRMARAQRAVDAEIAQLTAPPGGVRAS